MPVSISQIVAPIKIFTCSDGMSFNNARKAFKHEMYIRIKTLFPQNSIEYSKTIRAKRFHLGRHMFIRCGVYHIILKDREDLSTMNHFFRGIRKELDYPDDSEYPIEFDIEIFYEKIPGVILNSAQWRFYEE